MGRGDEKRGLRKGGGGGGKEERVIDGWSRKRVPGKGGQWVRARWLCICLGGMVKLRCRVCVTGRLVWLGIPGEPPGQGIPPGGWAEASWV